MACKELVGAVVHVFQSERVAPRSAIVGYYVGAFAIPPGYDVGGRQNSEELLVFFTRKVRPCKG